MKINNILKETKKVSENIAKVECACLPLQILMGVNKVTKGLASEAKVLGSLGNSAAIVLTFQGISLATSVAIWALEPKAKEEGAPEDNLDDLDQEFEDDLEDTPDSDPEPVPTT